jgi:hypothetical protein
MRYGLVFDAANTLHQRLVLLHEIQNLCKVAGVELA